MSADTPARTSMHDDLFLAVRVAAAEARRLNGQLGKLNGQEYVNPAMLAFEKLEAGLLRYTSEERSSFRDSSDDVLEPMTYSSVPIVPREGPDDEGDAEDGDSEETCGEIGEEDKALTEVPALELDVGFQHPGQNEAGSQVSRQISEDLRSEHGEGEGHENEPGTLKGDGGNQPDPEAEPDSLPPAVAVEGRPDTSIHIGE